MRLVTKVNLALVGVVAVSTLLNFAALRVAVMPSFAALEEQAADQNQSRVIEAIELQKEQVANSAGDYAIWDDTYEFMTGGGQDYEEKNITAESLKTLGVNYFVALDTSGTIVIDKGLTVVARS
jgi:sensor domain CHASE-containing protein